MVAPDTFKRPIYAGNAIATVRSKDAKKVITVRTTGFDNAAADGGSGTIEKIDAGAHSGGSDFVGLEASKSERPELTSAKVIVSGGRAFGSSDDFHRLLDPLADKLGAAVGAIIVLGADLIAQQVLPTALPTGVVTGIVGAPYLIWLLATVNREGRGG